jgi:hypothetical protein
MRCQNVDWIYVARTGFCEHGSELSCSIEGQTFLDQLKGNQNFPRSLLLGVPYLRANRKVSCKPTCSRDSRKCYHCCNLLGAPVVFCSEVIEVSDIEDDAG